MPDRNMSGLHRAQLAPSWTPGRAVDIAPHDAIAAFIERHSPFADDPDDDRPLSSLWTVLAWCTGAAAVCLSGGVVLRRIDRGFTRSGRRLR